MAHLLSFIDTNPQPATPQLPEPPKSINTASKTALVVANESLVRLLRRCFEEEGYTVRMASNTEEGMRLYRDFAPFNVVIIEYDAPHRDGVQVDYLQPQTSAKNLASDILKVRPSQGIIFAASAYQSPDDLWLPQELIHIPVLIEIGIFHLRTLLSTIEVRLAIQHLTVADKLRLKRSAEFWVRVRGLAPHERTAEDLLAEAQLKTLTGDRRWKRDFTFVQHLRKSMESISDGWAKKREHKETCLFSEISKPNAEGRESSPLDAFESDLPTAERSLEAKKEVARIVRLFTDDTEATQVLQGWYDSLKAHEIRQKYGLDEGKYAAAKKRIRLKVMSRRSGDDGGKEHGV
ncbi:MAG TPA: response regulator [Candidatus Polarisedimenticolia bacterium]|nr:response regulator [Candidatus Polarisedimenticolia bacterium]